MGRRADLLSHNDSMLERIESFIREHEPDRARRRGDRASSPAAPTRPASGTRSRELGYRVSALHVAHGLRGEESDEDARFCREAFGAEVVAESLSREADRGRRCATFATRSRPTGCARPATRPPTRSRRSCSASSPPARRSGSRRSARTASSGRCSRSGARRRAPTATSTGSPYREDSSNPDTKRGLIRDEILPLLERLDPRARASLLSLADERPRLPRTLERTLAELLASREGTKAADLGGGVRAVREYDTLRLEGAVAVGAVDDRVRARPGWRSARAGRGIGSQAAARKCRISSWTRRCRGRSATAGRSSSAATRSWRCRESPKRRAGKER